jgi:HK97 family phage major capsid protein
MDRTLLTAQIDRLEVNARNLRAAVARAKPTADERFRKLQAKARREMPQGIAALVRAQPTTGALAEFTAEMARSRPLRTSNSFYLPHSPAVELAMQRGLTQASASGGGYLTETKLGPAQAFPQPVPILLALGAQTIAANDALVIPRIVSPSVANTITNEFSAANATNPTIGTVALTPKTVGAYTELSQLLLKQSAAQQIIQRDQYRAVYAKVDSECLTGSGLGGEATGLINVPGVGTFSGSSLGLSTLLGLQVAAGDTLNSSAAFATNRTTAAVLRARPEVSGGTKTLLEGPLANGTVTDLPLLTTSELATGTLIFGSWSWAILALWGGIEVAVDPYQQQNFQAGIVGVRTLATYDFAVVWPAAFSVSTTVT